MKKKIDILINSASRPEDLERSLEALFEKFQFSGEVRYLFHEDVIDKKRSQKCLDIVKKTKVFQKIIVTDPNIGHGHAIKKMFPFIESDIIFRTEDDYGYLRKIKVDKIVGLFEDALDVNLVLLNKRPNMKEQSGMEQREVIKGGLKLTTSYRWHFTPGFWRMNWIRPRFVPYRFACRMSKGLKEGAPDPITVDWMMKNIGCYFYEGFGEGKYIFHMGRHKNGNITTDMIRERKI